jgi:asparagine synthase (glutamine-hydrolysing)
MCGFVASIGNPGAVKRSIASISYRGLPEHTSFHDHGYIHIAHNRLPIVDLTSNGDQPARIGDHIGFLVGEVFNFKQFSHANTDTKAALEVFLKEGLKGFHKFDGFWSFITIHEGKLLAATDYLSQKPIYYRTDTKAIASEPVALLEFGDTYTNSFDEVFFSNVKKWGYDPTGRTPWENIKQLPAGHYWYDGDIRPYWNWHEIAKTDIKESIVKATKNRLLGDQPIACLLSGGLDSSIVFSLCRQLGANISSYHVDNDESEFAKMVDPNTKALPLEGLSYLEAIRYNQSPVDLGSVHPQAVLAQAVAKEGFHVCLTGDGADELFGGYSRSEKYDSQGSDVFVELPYYHLPRLDRLMMRHTIELRTPFLAPEVIKSAISLPSYSRKGKSLLKTAFADTLPEAILKREKKALKTLKIKNGGIKQIEDNIKLFKDIYK